MDYLDCFSTILICRNFMKPSTIMQFTRTLNFTNLIDFLFLFCPLYCTPLTWDSSCFSSFFFLLQALCNSSVAALCPFISQNIYCFPPYALLRSQLLPIASGLLVKLPKKCISAIICILKIFLLHYSTPGKTTAFTYFLITYLL